MIAVQVGEGSTVQHGHRLAVGRVVLLDATPALLVVAVQVDRGNPADRALDPVAVAVVDEARRDRAAHLDQAVLGVVGQGEAPAAHGAPGHVVERFPESR